MSEPVREFSIAAPPPAPDPDLAPIDEPTILDQLRADAKKKVGPPELTLAVPARPDYTVRYSTELEWHQAMAWRKRAADHKLPGGVDQVRFSGIVLGSQCRAILHKGTEARGEDGELLTFRSKEFQEIFGVRSAAEAARKFLALDGHVIAAAERVLAEAGFGEEADEAEEDEDSPFGGSSSSSKPILD